MNTDLNTEELDIQISKDVFDLENVALAFWEDVLASSPNLMKGGSGSIRTIVLSETATLVANARPIGSAITTPPQGILITHGLVSLDVGFRLHYLASVHHHKKLPKEVKSRWVEVCLDIVEKLERGMVVVIPTSEEVMRRTLQGHRFVDMGHGRQLICTGSELQMLVSHHPKERVERCAAQRTPSIIPGIFQELLHALKSPSGWN